MKKIKPVTRATAQGLIAQHLANVRLEEAGGLSKAQKELIEWWAQDPWNFIAGKDEDGKPVYFTKDERDSKAPVKPFPEYEYLKDYIERLRDETFVFVDKARQLVFSTATLAYASWECLFLPGRRWLLSRSKEDDAVELLQDKVRTPIRYMPQWFRKWSNVSSKPQIRVDYRRTGSYLLAVTQNVGESSARGGSASGFILDEAAFQSEFGSILGAAAPMAAKFVAISTPPDQWNPGAEEFYRIVSDTAEVI